MLSAFLDSTRRGLSRHTLLFYQRCLRKATGIGLIRESINRLLSSSGCGNGEFAQEQPGYWSEQIENPEDKRIISLFANSGQIYDAGYFTLRNIYNYYAAYNQRYRNKSQYQYFLIAFIFEQYRRKTANNHGI